MATALGGTSGGRGMQLYANDRGHALLGPAALKTMRLGGVKMNRSLFAVNICLTLGCVIVYPGSMRAQGSTGQHKEMARRIPVLVALSDTASFREGGLILRRKSPTNDVILLSADATGAELAAAIYSLNVIRDVSGDTAVIPGMLRTNSRRPKSWATTEDIAAERFLIRLRKSDYRMVDGIGRVKAATLYLPSKAMRKNSR